MYVLNEMATATVSNTDFVRHVRSLFEGKKLVSTGASSNLLTMDLKIDNRVIAVTVLPPSQMDADAANMVYDFVTTTFEYIAQAQVQNQRKSYDDWRTYLEGPFVRILKAARVSVTVTTV